MATFRKRSGNWQARVTRKGYETLSKTFTSKRDAEFWAREIEGNIDKGAYKNLRYAQKITFQELIERFKYPHRCVAQPQMPIVYAPSQSALSANSA